MRIAVLRGGPSNHYDASLRTGEEVLSVLRQGPERYKPLDIFISRDGNWHVMGRVLEPHDALRHVDLVWNALHGEYGEDGKMNKLLTQMNISHTGSERLGLALATHKDLARKAYIASGLLTPRYQVLGGHVTPEELVVIFRSYVHPVIVRPVSGKTGFGSKLVHNFEHLKDAVSEAFKHGARVMVEELVRGKEATCSIVENFRGRSHYILLPYPPVFKSETHKEIEQMAELAHRSLGLRHYSSSHFVVTPKGKIYILETSALPELSPDSHLSKSLQNIGASHKEFVNHVISLAV